MDCLIASFAMVIAFASQVFSQPQTLSEAVTDSNAALAEKSAPAQNTAPAPAGVGILITGDTAKGYVVQYVLPDMPAAKANVQIGDVLLAIDGQPVEKFANLDEVVAKIRGLPASTVKLKLLGSNSQTREVSLARTAIPSAKVQSTPADFGREKAVYFFQFEDLIPNESYSSFLKFDGSSSVRKFLRTQLKQRHLH